MGSSRALVCSTAFVLVLFCSASEDEHMFEQREVTFDLEKIMQEFPTQQRIVPEPEDILTERGSSRPGILPPRGRRPVFGPRSFGPPILDYPVQFPLSRPTSNKLQAICLHGDHRPRYPVSYFPASGFGQLKRRAGAVNIAESWFSTCCKGNQTWERDVTLCCVTQAWELFVQSFCVEDSSIKDAHYHCCKLTGSDRLNCFNNDAPKPNYEGTGELQTPSHEGAEELLMPTYPFTDSFSFDPNTCQRTVMTPYSVRANRRKKMKKPLASQKVDINFPPGRPTEHVIEPLCSNLKLRPLYNIKCLPGSGYELVARQAKTINRIEKGFKQCCKRNRNILNCADGKWQDELDKFCRGENGEQVDFHCCSASEANDRYSCFQNISPDPHFNKTSAAEELSLHSICNTHKIIKKKFPVGFPLKSFVHQCCPLAEQEKSTCFDEKLKKISGNLCSSKKPTPPAVRRCCRKPSPQNAPECISNILMDGITKAANVLRQKKRKKCPLS
ncbi:extracellular matrix protein 1 isoform X2 [Halichoeres trimaculatus]|uniref:extracellular matrix protein 1 isoform X2 n=1 Tax=Halichoeres trimaculatus TaxID=147232 RepID=UPI003D9DE628